MRPLVVPFLIVAAWLPVSSQAQGAEQLRSRLSELAKKVLQATDDRPVSVGVFSPVRLADSNSALGMEETFKEELNRIKPGIVQENAPFEVKGDYAFVKSSDESRKNLKVVRISARVIDVAVARELVAVGLDVELDAPAAIAQVVQPTVAIDPRAKKEDKNEQLAKAALPESRTVHIHGTPATLVSSVAASPYAIEVLAGPPGKPQPRPAIVDEGQAFVALQAGETYRIRIRNGSDADVAVSVTIDGLDVYHFTDDRFTAEDAKRLNRSELVGRPKFSHLIIPRASTGDVAGWHKSVGGKENYLSFLVVGSGQGAIAKAGVTSRGKVGVIHVQFARCKALPEGAIPKGGEETGFGPPQQVTQKPARYSIESPHEFVSIRYARP